MNHIDVFLLQFLVWQNGMSTLLISLFVIPDWATVNHINEFLLEFLVGQSGLS